MKLNITEQYASCLIRLLRKYKLELDVIGEGADVTTLALTRVNEAEVDPKIWVDLFENRIVLGASSSTILVEEPDRDILLPTVEFGVEWNQLRPDHVAVGNKIAEYAHKLHDNVPAAIFVRKSEYPIDIPKKFRIMQEILYTKDAVEFLGKAVVEFCEGHLARWQLNLLFDTARTIHGVPEKKIKAIYDNIIKNRKAISELI